MLPGSHSEYGSSPLHLTVEKCHLNVAQFLCEQGADNEARDAIRKTPLLCAAEYGHLHVAEYVCEPGVAKEVMGKYGINFLG